MSRSRPLFFCVRLTLTAAAAAAALPAYSADALPEVIVTAQKRSESIQDVPIAVSAYSQDELTARGLDGGPQILQAIPNVTFSKQNFTSYNLQIRGVGSKLIAASGDQGVGIHLNNAPLAASRFFEAEFFDMERIEVLRGPQGTLYGRNATGGVFNAITAKPTNELGGSASMEFGNYGSTKFKAMVNAPISEMFQLRLAASALKRDGYIHNTVTDSRIDGRDLFSSRVTLAFTPSDVFNGYLMWEHFKEDDDRQRAGAQLCTKDPGPETVGGVSTTIASGFIPTQPRWFLSQGCLPGSLYSAGARGTLNTNGALGGVFSNAIGMYPGDMYAGQRISDDLRTNSSFHLPTYRAEADLVQLNLEWSVSDTLTFTSLTSYNDDSVNSQQDYNRTVPNGKFDPNAFLATTPGISIFPGGVFDDPQIGLTDTLSVYDKSFIESQTWTQELRLQSAFDGPLNFNVGAIYIDQDSPDQGYYVFFNTGTAYARCYNLGLPFCPQGTNPPGEIYEDPNREPNGEGHNYYLNKQTFSLRSLAGFGELYWQATDSFKATLGLRYTNDKKEADSYDFTRQFIYPGRGFPPETINRQTAQFKETTGRVGVDWKLNDDTLLYAFYSRGYKGGGFNSATAGNVKTEFDPEFVNAIEVGVKSLLLDGRLQMNGTVFSYDYDGYQISRIVNLTSVNDNIDADIHGAELEMVFQPFTNTRLDANIGYLKTKIKNGSSIDVMNRTQGDTSLTLVKGANGTNCTVPTTALGNFISLINNQTEVSTPDGPYTPQAGHILGACRGELVGFGLTPTDGHAVNLKGKELPSSPHWTISLGAQQTIDFGNAWSMTARVDYYQQGDSFARIYNSEFDRIEGWSNVNVSFAFENDDLGLNILAYVKNALDDDNITDAYLTDDSSGLYTNTFLTDPRLFGVSITKKF